MIRRCQPLLGTFVELTLEGGSDEALHKEANKAFDLIRCVQKQMSYHDAESDVSRLNRCAHIAPLRVHPWTWQVIELALKLSAETSGVFDITIAPKLVKWGYLPRHQAFSPMMEAAQWQDIELLSNSHIRYQRPLHIDLGGIAKGFAVDKAIDYLATRGIEQASVNAGGDLRVLGSAALAIRDPQSPQAKQYAAPMLRPAVATSGAYFAKRRVGVARVNPIVHPHTGKPVRQQACVSVFAHTCVEADALTKAVLLAPQAVWNALLKARDACALFITQRGEQVLYPA
jgi:FAD:protein FMN transferase